MELQPGTVLAHRFEVTSVEEHDRAHAVDRATGDTVQVRVLRGISEEARQRLEERLSALKRASCGSVCHPRGMWPLGGGDWVLVKPGPAEVRLTDAAPLTPKDAVRVGIAVAEALVAAHRVGVVHGDVGPDHVVPGTAGALLAGFDGLDGAIQPGVTAPEVSVGGPAGVPADLYGLGVVLHVALHGRLPFSSEDGPWAALAAQDARPRVKGPRGLATLIASLLDPDPAARPANASVVRTALLRLRRDPQRWISVSQFEAPRLRWNRAWLVHGTDPATGAPAIMAAELTKHQAFSLVERLRREGWSVRPAQEAFGGRDVMWVTLVGTLGGMVVPVLGFVPAALMAWVWRSRRVDANLRNALPMVSSPLPRADEAGRRTMIVAGLLLVAAALGMLFGVEVAAVPVGLLVVWLMVARRRDDPARLASAVRVSDSLAEVRLALERRPLPLDQALGIQGQVDALEGAWRVGDLAAAEILAELAELGKQVHGSEPMRSGAHPAMTALRARDVPPRLETT